MGMTVLTNWMTWVLTGAVPESVVALGSSFNSFRQFLTVLALLLAIWLPVMAHNAPSEVRSLAQYNILLP